MPATLPPRGDEDEDAFPEPPRLRRLRRLVTALTVILGLGMLVITGSIAWRLLGPGALPPPAAAVGAESLTLPEGRAPVALGATGTEILVWTRDAAGAERLMLFRRSDGRLLSDTPVRREP